VPIKKFNNIFTLQSTAYTLVGHQSGGRWFNNIMRRLHDNNTVERGYNSKLKRPARKFELSKDSSYILQG